MGNLNIQSFSFNGGGSGQRDTGLMLIDEEIGDIVASTALLLGVRGPMGGRDKRKGGGWELRGCRAPRSFSFSPSLRIGELLIFRHLSMFIPTVTGKR